MPPAKSPRKRTRLTRYGDRLQIFTPPVVAERIRVEAAKRQESISDNAARRLAESCGLDFDTLVAAGA